MKKKVAVFASLLFLVVSFSFAQGGFQRRTVEERVKMVMDKLADFKLDKDKSAKVETIFTDYYKDVDKMREEMMGGGGAPDRDAIREKMTKMMGDRDEKLKKEFTEEQYKKWKDEIEPSMRPQRRGGGGGNG